MVLVIVYQPSRPEKFQFLNINPRKIDWDTSDAVLSLDGLPIDKSDDIKLLDDDDDLVFKKHFSWAMYQD